METISIACGSPLESFLSIVKGPSNGTIPRHSLQHPPRRLKPVVENQVWCTDEKPPTFGAPHSEPIPEQKEENKKNNKEWR